MSATLDALDKRAAELESEARRKIATNDAAEVLDGLRCLQRLYGRQAPEVHEAIASVETWVMDYVRKFAGDDMRWLHVAELHR